MIWQLFSSITNEEKTQAVEDLFERSAPSMDFFLMIILSVLMAALGLLANSPAVIVGSMLIAPMLYPILGLAMGIIMSDSQLVTKSFITLLKATGLGIAVSAIVSLLFGLNMTEYTPEILARGEPSLLAATIGAVAGLAAAFATVKTKLSETLPGVAISVALIPPLAVVGIALSRLDVTLFFNSLLLFIVNAAGVVFTASIVFSMMNLYVKRHVAKEVVREEEERLQQEIGTKTTKEV